MECNGFNSRHLSPLRIKLCLQIPLPQSTTEEEIPMAQQQVQEDGWPLGLQPLNVRAGLVRNSEIIGSVSFNTLLTSSPTSSTDSSSDLDTQSTGSFFHDTSITLGSLIGISSILHLSRRGSSRGIKTAQTARDYKNKPKTWLFSLCSKLNTDAVVTMNNNNTPSLRHFLQEEKIRAAAVSRRNQSPIITDPNLPFSQ